jgi:hypothetical protein
MEKTKKIPIGLVIKQIVEEKKLKVADIAKLGTSLKDIVLKSNIV